MTDFLINYKKKIKKKEIFKMKLKIIRIKKK
jgi:hypothetical protein